VLGNYAAIYVFLGNGDGSFQSPPVGSAGAAGFQSESLATADFNSDGNLDLTTGEQIGDPSPYTALLALGNGKGSFTANALTDVNNGGGAAAIIATDLNGDGFPDLVVWAYGGLSLPSTPAVSVLLNCGLRCTNTVTTSSTATSVFNQPVTFTATVTAANAKATGTPTGTVTFQVTTDPSQSPNPVFPPVTTTLGNATLSNGVATLTYSGLTAEEAYSVSASYPGDSNFNSSTSAVDPPPAPPTLLVQRAPTTLALSSSADPSSPGQSVTLTAKATPSTSGVLTGTVTFSDNGDQLVSQPLNSSGTATFTTSGLSAGTHSITGTYTGDSNFNGSTSAAITQIVGTNAAPFTVSASPSAATVSAGASANFTITLATAPSAKSAILLSCSGLPTGASCSFSPAQITPKGASTTTMLTITTTGSGSVFDPFPSPPRWPRPALPLAFLGLAALGILAATRKRQMRNAALPALVLVCVFAVMMGIGACGGNSSNTSQDVTPKGTTQISVMASSNGQSQTTAVSLTVN
jgi:Bacterial Ig-like domain (group 3)/FG-GAP-like repeat